MAPMPHLYYALSRASQKAAIFGDFRQLPPIAICRDSDLVAKWLSRDIYEQAGISEAVNQGNGHPLLQTLREQFRMAKQIAEISNKFFYDGMLVTKTHESDLPPVAVAGSRLILYDTGNINPWASRLESGSRYNIYNAALINEIITESARDGDDTAIGIITPYRAQAKLVNLMLADSGYRAKVSTVHKFQGLGHDSIILDTCDGPPVNPSPLLNEQLSGDAKRLLNVAITRPRSQLMVVGNVRYLRKKLPRDSYILRLIEEIQSNGDEIDTSSLLSGYLCDNFEKWKSFIEPPFDDVDPDELGNLYRESNFYPAFFADLWKARKEIIIVSPFVAANRASQFFDLFRYKKSKGVSIKVFTRPRKTQEKDMFLNAGEVFDELEGIGIPVKGVYRCHQKLAIIDRTIAWEGSLNILSQSYSKEHMRRKGNHPRTCAELIKMHDLDWDPKTEAEKPRIKVMVSCEDCGREIEVRRGKFGPFLGCSKYPRCKYIRKVNRGDSIETDQRCSEGHRMVIKRGPRGLFLGCEKYPDHKETRPL